MAVALVVFANLPWWPVYLRGFLTGSLLAGALWMAAWIVWVTSGLSVRLNGTWAEEAVLSSLRKAARVHDVVPSLKFGKRDIDAVAVTPAAVYAIETKWRGQKPGHASLVHDGHAAALAARTLRLSLNGRGVPGDLVRPVLVVCGPGAREMASSNVETPLGMVVVVPAVDFDRWLDSIPHGPIGPDYAAGLAAELHAHARRRDSLNVEAGPVLRHLGRVR